MFNVGNYWEDFCVNGLLGFYILRVVCDVLIIVVCLSKLC